jgi:cell division septum initiation protein DivIVA
MSYLLREIDRMIDRIENELGELLNKQEVLETELIALENAISETCNARATILSWREKQIKKPPTEVEATMIVPSDGTGYYRD